MSTEIHSTMEGMKAKIPTRRSQYVMDEIRRQLKEGLWEPGVKLPPLRELAERFNVSTNTVRNALRMLNQEGKIQHIPSIGSFVRPIFPVRSANKKITMALITDNLDHPFGMSIARGVEKACQTRTWQLQVYNSRSDPRLEADNIARLRDSGADGAVILPTGEEDSFEAFFNLKAEGFPFVIVDCSIRGLKVDWVQSDHRKGAYLATEHLIKQGHKRVLIITGRQHMSSEQSRLIGYEQALLEYDLVPFPKWKIGYELKNYTSSEIEHGRWWGPAYRAVVSVLRDYELPIGIFAINEGTALGLLEACRELGLQVPDDVSIVSFDDSEITRAMYPPMTVVAQDTVGLGRCAVELLEERLKSRDKDPQRIVLDVQLIKRQSVARQNRKIN